MKRLLSIVCFGATFTAISVCGSVPMLESPKSAAQRNGKAWTIDRLSHLLGNSGRFVESDYVEVGAMDIPKRNRNALPLFEDVFRESGWSTNELITSLICIASNGLAMADWDDPNSRRSAVVAMCQLSDINHPMVTNYFHSIASNDLHGAEIIVYPALFQYTQLEPCVMERMYDLCVHTNLYDRAGSAVAFELLDALKTVDAANKEAARLRVAQYLYHSMRQLSHSQSWQDKSLVRLVPGYSNSVQRLEQAQFIMQNSTNNYEVKKAKIEYSRLSSMPTNELHDVSWITERQ